MSMAFERFCLTVSLAIPYAHLLSVLIGVGGCGWPRNSSVLRIMQPSWALWKRAPTSASVADDMTFCRMMHTIWMAPLSFGGGAVETVGLEGVYVATCYDANGNEKWSDTIENLTTNVGRKNLMDSYFGNTGGGAIVRP